MINISKEFYYFQSISVASELFEMDILNLPISLQKDILFMIMRSQKPITLSTGPIGKLGLETYLSVSFNFRLIFRTLSFSLLSYLIFLGNENCLYLFYIVGEP